MTQIQIEDYARLTQRVLVLRPMYVCGACGSYVRKDADRCPSCEAILVMGRDLPT